MGLTAKSYYTGSTSGTHQSDNYCIGSIPESLLCVDKKEEPPSLVKSPAVNAIDHIGTAK